MKENEFKPDEFTPLGNGIFPDEQTLQVSKDLTNAVLNGLGPIKDTVQILTGDMPNGIITYLAMVKTDGETDGETEVNIPMINLKTLKKFFVMETFKVTIDTTMEQVHDLKRLYGIDIPAMINDRLIEDHINVITRNVLDKIKSLSNKNIFDLKDTLWQKVTKFIYRIINKPYERKFKVDNIRKIIAKILAAGNKIAVKGRRGPATYCICSSGMAALLSDSGTFTFTSPNGNVISESHSFEYAGNIAGIQVMVDRSMKFNDMTVYVGRKGMEGEPGIYMPIMTTGSSVIRFDDTQTKNTSFSMIVRRCIINTDECNDRIAELKFQFTGALKKEFLGK